MGIKEAHERIIDWEELVVRAIKKEGEDRETLLILGILGECREIIEEECPEVLKQTRSE